MTGQSFVSCRNTDVGMRENLAAQRKELWERGGGIRGKGRCKGPKERRNLAPCIKSKELSAWS